MTNYHMLPCGTVIPPEGIELEAWDAGSSGMKNTCIAYADGVPYPVRCINGAMYSHYRIPRPPKRNPLSPDTYHGEPLRYPYRIGNERCYLYCSALRWHEKVVTVWADDDAPLNLDWASLAENYERYLDGKWQPCYVEED